MTSMVAASRPSYLSGTSIRIGRISSALPPSMRKSGTGPKRYFCQAEPAGIASRETSTAIGSPLKPAALSTRQRWPAQNCMRQIGDFNVGTWNQASSSCALTAEKLAPLPIAGFEAVLPDGQLHDITGYLVGVKSHSKTIAHAS